MAWTEAEFLAYDRETIELIADKESEVQELENKAEAAKSHAAELKKAADRSCTELRGTIRERRYMRGKPRQKTLTSELEDRERKAKDAAAEPKATETEDDGVWKLFPIAGLTDFGLTPGDVAKLHAGELKEGQPFPIKTMGDLNKFVTPDSTNPSFARGLKDFKGFGEKAVDRLAEAEARFWAKWNAGLHEKFKAEIAPAPVDPSPVEATAADEAQPPASG